MTLKTSATSSGSSARHLVEEHDARPHRERPHDRDALLLAAREPIRVLVLLVEQAEALE
jgi:hypothetical protein